MKLISHIKQLVTLAHLFFLPLAAFAQADLTVCEGQGYTLKSASGKEAAGIGNSPLTFTWYEKYNDEPAGSMTNSNAESITIPGKKSAGTYEYTRKVASVECPDGVSTTPYTVLVHPLPKVAQSGASTFCDNGAHTLTVNAFVDGDGVSVAWYTDANLSGSTVSNTTSCTVSASTVVGTYTYYVQATANTTQCKAAATVTATRAQTEGEIGGWRFPSPDELTTTGETTIIVDPRDSQTYTVVKMPDNRVWFAQNLNYAASLTWNQYSNKANGKDFTSEANGAPAIGSYWCPSAQSATSSSSATCATYGALYTWETVMMIDGKWADENQSSSTWDETWMSGYYHIMSNSPNSDNAKANRAQGGRGICPKGWHVPTEYEWAVMLDAAESATPTSTVHTNRGNDNWGGTYSGRNLKSAATCTDAATCAENDTPKWQDHANRGTDVFGFRVLPTSLRNYLGQFINVNYEGTWFWTSTPTASNTAVNHWFDFRYADVARHSNLRSYGFSVRCIMDFNG